MATKGKITERVQNCPSLFPELGGEIVAASPLEGKLFGDDLERVSFGGEPQRSKEPRRRLNGYLTHNYKGKEKTSREKRNTELWASLYPTPKR